MVWRHGRWTAEHPLPIGVTERMPPGQRVRAGDIIAAGVVLGTATRLPAARRLGLGPGDLERELRVPLNRDVLAGTLLGRVGRRVPRTLKAPIDGRLLHLTADGDVFLAQIVDRWVVRSALDGVVARSDDAALAVEGEAWCLDGLAAYGPDAVGELALGTESASGELPPSRIDVRLAGRILVCGARVSAEVMTRAHACGVVGLVAGAAPAAGLRVVFGDTVTSSGSPGREERPTVLCLLGFGSVTLPPALHRTLVALAGSRAAIHTASSRLFVFAPADAADAAPEGTDLALAADYGAVRPVADQVAAAEVELPSEVRTSAVRVGDSLVPVANVRRLGR